MKFIKKLIKGTFVKRYKRFFAEVKHKNQILTSHCPNSGSMMGLIEEGNTAWVSKSKNPKRKLKYTLELIKIKKDIVGVNTHRTNKIVHEALKMKKIQVFKNCEKIYPESVYDKDTRFDFLLIQKKRKIFLEVKNVTLVRDNKIAEFPDSITSRGTKHLLKLIEAKKKGYESYMLYLIQRTGCESFKIAKDIDKVYEKTFKKAILSGVKILCYDCAVTSNEVMINNKVKLLL